GLTACDAIALKCGELATGFTGDPLDTDLLSFKMEAGEQVWVTVEKFPGSGSQYEPAWRLLDASGAPAGPGGLYARGLLHADCGILPPSASPYVIEVGDEAHDDVGQYRAVVDCTRTVSAEGAASSTFELAQNRPNPLTSRTTIQFALAFPV